MNRQDELLGSSSDETECAGAEDEPQGSSLPGFGPHPFLRSHLRTQATVIASVCLQGGHCRHNTEIQVAECALSTWKDTILLQGFLLCSKAAEPVDRAVKTYFGAVAETPSCFHCQNSLRLPSGGPGPSILPAAGAPLGPAGML